MKELDEFLDDFVEREEDKPKIKKLSSTHLLGYRKSEIQVESLLLH